MKNEKTKSSFPQSFYDMVHPEIIYWPLPIIAHYASNFIQNLYSSKKNLTTTISAFIDCISDDIMEVEAIKIADLAYIALYEDFDPIKLEAYNKIVTIRGRAMEKFLQSGSFAFSGIQPMPAQLKNVINPTPVTPSHPFITSEIISYENFAISLYDEYCMHVGGKAFNGDPLPAGIEFFSDSSKTKQADAWRAVARFAVFGKLK